MSGMKELCRRTSLAMLLGTLAAGQSIGQSAVARGPVPQDVTQGQVTQDQVIQGQASPTPATQIADGHADPLTFSLQYPQDSQVTVSREDDIAIVSPVPGSAPPLEIHTEARLLREDPAAVVGPYIEQLLAEDALVLLYRTLEVDGQSGIRLWLGERPDPNTGELTNSLVTFVGYGTTETAQMITYYTDDAAEAAAVALHDSFMHLAPPTE